jgi:hypothetical protein
MTDSQDVVPETLRELVNAERARPDPPAEVGQRVLHRLSATLGLPPGLGDGGPTAPGPSSAPTPAGTGLVGHTLAGAAQRWLLALLVGSAVGTATYGILPHVRAKREAPAARVAVPAAAPTAEVPPTAPAAVEARAAEPAAAPTRRTREPESSVRETRDHALAAERQLVETARTALARGSAESALVALHRHARAFPRGRLSEERESLLVQALVAQGRFALARQQAVRFAHKYPHSLFQPVVEESLRSIP